MFVSGIDVLDVFHNLMDGCYRASNLDNPRDENNFIYTRFLEEDGPMLFSVNFGNRGLWTLEEFPYDANFSLPLGEIRLTNDSYSLASNSIMGEIYSPVDADMWTLYDVETLLTVDRPNITIYCGCELGGKEEHSVQDKISIRAFDIIIYVVFSIVVLWFLVFMVRWFLYYNFYREV